MTSEVTALLRPGGRAPNVVLPAVNQDGTISFEDYWSRGWLLLGLFRGAPFVAARHELNRQDGYVLTTDEVQVRAAGPGLQMLFLIDRGGVIRWRWIETAEQPRAFGRLFPLSGLLAEVGTTVACADVSR
jgi:hypothetical protein